jgi:hypothetical protein
MKENYWKFPPKIKIYEAIGALADKRLKVENGENRLYSSSGNKFYIIKYDENENSIMVNDNGSYWKGYLGYPAIAFLINIGQIKFNQKFLKALGNIKWKDINTEFKNDFEKTIQYCHHLIEERGFNLNNFLVEIDNIEKQVKKLKLKKLGKKIFPPKGY